MLGTVLLISDKINLKPKKVTKTKVNDKEVNTLRTYHNIYTINTQTMKHIKQILIDIKGRNQQHCNSRKLQYHTTSNGKTVQTENQQGNVGATLYIQQ